MVPAIIATAWGEEQPPWDPVLSPPQPPSIIIASLPQTVLVLLLITLARITVLILMLVLPIVIIVIAITAAAATTVW